MTIDRHYRPTFILSLLFFTSLRLTALGDIALPLSFSSPLAPGTDNIVNMFKVRWERNGSARYDGRTQDIPEDWIIESDRERGVNESIRVEWGQSGRLWNALVLEKKPVPTPLDLALPAKRVKTASPSLQEPLSPLAQSPITNSPQESSMHENAQIISSSPANHPSPPLTSACEHTTSTLGPKSASPSPVLECSGVDEPKPQSKGKGKGRKGKGKKPQAKFVSEDKGEAKGEPTKKDRAVKVKNDADSEERKTTNDLLIQLQKAQVQILQHLAPLPQILQQLTSQQLTSQQPAPLPPTSPQHQPRSATSYLTTATTSRNALPDDPLDLDSWNIPDDVLSLTDSLISESPASFSLPLTSSTSTPLSPPIEAPYSHYYGYPVYPSSLPPPSKPAHPHPLPAHSTPGHPTCIYPPTVPTHTMPVPATSVYPPPVHTHTFPSTSTYRPPFSTHTMPVTPPRATNLMLPPTASPRRPMGEILGRYHKEKDAGRVAVHLAQFNFFGETTMTRTTAARLDQSKMQEIKQVIISKFVPTRSLADKEEVWRRCRVAIGQKCKQLRTKK